MYTLKNPKFNHYSVILLASIALSSLDATGTAHGAQTLHEPVAIEIQNNAYRTLHHERTHSVDFLQTLTVQHDLRNESATLIQTKHPHGIFARATVAM